MGNMSCLANLFEVFTILVYFIFGGATRGRLVHCKAILNHAMIQVKRSKQHVIYCTKVTDRFEVDSSGPVALA